jgi:predicted Zn-dependent protease
MVLFRKNIYAFCASCILIGCVGAVSPAQMFKPSKQEQLKAGKEYSIQIRKENKILPDSDPRVQLLRKFGERILATRTPDELKKEPWEFSFDVIESKDVNAFAVPGGPIFFFTGLIDKMKSEEELAGVLGHELIHIRREHWASAVNASREKSLGIVLLGSIFNASRDTMNAVQLVKQFGVDLPAGRGQERESDVFGMDCVVKAGFNPKGMVEVFKMFQSLKGKNGGPPEWASTHPDDKNRIANLEKMIVDMQNKGRLPKELGPLTPLPFETLAMKEAKNPPKDLKSGKDSQGQTIPPPNGGGKKR